MLGLRRRITMRILEMLRRHERPWRVEYRPDHNCGQPRNVRTGGLYRGVNPLLLNSAAQRFGYLSCWWGSERDWRSVGATVPETARGVTVVIYKRRRSLSDLGEEIVFNAADVKNATSYCPMMIECPMHHEIEVVLAAETTKSTRADMRIGVGDYNNDKYYSGYIYPVPYNKWPNHTYGDYILVPTLNAMRDIHLPEYFCNQFHELIHWAEIRTNFFDRLCNTELVAEIGCYYLAQECEMPPDEGLGHYNQWREAWMHWIDKCDTLIFRLAAQARRAADYVLSLSRGRRNDSYYHDCDPIVILPYYLTAVV